MMSALFTPRKFPFEGEMLTLKEISERIGVPTDTIRNRLYNLKMPYEKAFSPTDHRIEHMREINDPILIEYEGRTVTITELSEILGIKRQTILTRYRVGDRGERLWRPLDRKSKGRKRWYD